MSPEDTTRCQQGIDLYNSGQKQEAYKIFCDLYDSGNTKDVTLLFWLAYTTPDLKEAERALQNIEYFELDHPLVSKLQKKINRWKLEASARMIGPSMTCPYCHRTELARVAKKVSVAGWIWFAVFFVLFLACLFTPIEYIQTYTSLVPADPGQAQSLVGEAVCFLLLGFVGFLFKKRYYTCGNCGIKLGDIAH